MPGSQKKARDKPGMKLARPAREGAAHDKPRSQYNFSILGGL
jgi:hypothetical protein